MKTHIVKIGNSRGIRIPKTLLKQCQLEDAIELEVQNGQLVIRSLTKPRTGWKQSFEQMASRNEDQLLDPSLPSGSDWDRTEWTW